MGSARSRELPSSINPKIEIEDIKVGAFRRSPMLQRVRIAGVLFVAALGYIAWMTSSGDYSVVNALKATVGDKTAHFIFAALLTFFLNAAFPTKAFRVWRFSILPLSLVILALLAADEFSHYFIAARSVEVFDLLANFSGVLIADLYLRNVFFKNPWTRRRRRVLMSRAG